MLFCAPLHPLAPMRLTPCSSLVRPASQAVPGSFCGSYASCLHVLFRVARPLYSNGGVRETSLGVGSLRGYRCAQALTMQGGLGGTMHSATRKQCPCSSNTTHWFRRCLVIYCCLDKRGGVTRLQDHTVTGPSTLHSNVIHVTK